MGASRFVALVSGFVLFSGLLVAQSGPPATDQQDPEDRNHGVARVSLLNGDVSVRRGDSGDYVAASINAPLLSLDSIQTSQASRAEIQFDYAHRLRISDNAEIRLAELTADHYQVQVARGTVTAAIMAGSNTQIEIDTPSIAIRPTGQGDYRITVREDGTSEFTVRSGVAQVYTPSGMEQVSAGQTMLARGAADNPEFQMAGSPGRDEWDVFNERRDHELERTQSYQYVSREIPGAEDLDSYGHWVSDPTYGNVWAPRVAAGWAPYRAGRWVWEDYYGWTWLSTDPWGWAPYHYGNWFYGNAGWCWYPGAYRSHYWYRPALVGFFGFGSGASFGVGFGFGNIGWVPLAPYEAFHPWYGRFGGAYGRGFGGVNIVNNVNITNVYRNARFNNGITAVNSQDFSNGRFGRYANVSASQVGQASSFRGAVPLTPTAQNLRFNDRQVAGNQRNTFQNTKFAGNSRGEQAGRVPFQQQQRNMEQSFGRQNSSGQQFGNDSGRQFGRVGQAQQGTTNSRFGQQNSASGTSSWQRFGSPNGSSFGRTTQQQPQQQQQQARPGNNNGFASAPRSQQSSPSWGRFGEPGQSATRSNNRGSAPPQNGGNTNWGQFGNSRNSGSQAAPNYQQSRPSQFGQGQSSQRQFGSSPNQFQGGSRSIQVAPPVVQQRSGSFGNSGGSSNSGFGRSSQPSYHSSPAPSSRGGGSGGASRPSGGSSGGGHRGR